MHCSRWKRRRDPHRARRAWASNCTVVGQAKLLWVAPGLFQGTNCSALVFDALSIVNGLPPIVPMALMATGCARSTYKTLNDGKLEVELLAGGIEVTIILLNLHDIGG